MLSNRYPGGLWCNCTRASLTRAASRSPIIPIRSDSRTFRFQPHEGFEYVYDLGDNWEHDIRVEKILALDPARAYPVCIGGAHPCPPEDSGGPWLYMSLRRTRKSHRVHRKTRSPGKANDTEDQFDRTVSTSSSMIFRAAG